MTVRLQRRPQAKGGRVRVRWGCCSQDPRALFQHTVMVSALAQRGQASSVSVSMGMWIWIAAVGVALAG